MKLKPISFKKACEFVDEIHRHHRRPQGHKFSISLVDKAGETVGVIIVGRPVARHLDDGWSAEVTRLAVKENTPNGCSMLYGAARRAAKAMGYEKIYTYILDLETGTSLKASGWKLEDNVKGSMAWKLRKEKQQTLFPFEKKRNLAKVQDLDKQRWSICLKT
jgi:hypothetical protein